MSFDIMKIFDIIILVLGVYIAYCAVRVKGGNIPTTFVAPEDVRKCKDKEGLCKAIFMPACVFGVVSLVYGVYSVIFDFGIIEAGSDITSILNAVLILIFVIGWVYFSYVLRKSVAKFCM
ncbi:MAG: hypothetical protein K5675_02745 [Lachnospiraceae bacterium]|nr:hypothetical protein [Lachnospiraceae bacterium]